MRKEQAGEQAVNFAEATKPEDVNFAKTTVGDEIYNAAEKEKIVYEVDARARGIKAISYLRRNMKIEFGKDIELGEKKFLGKIDRLMSKNADDLKELAEKAENPRAHVSTLEDARHLTSREVADYAIKDIETHVRIPRANRDEWTKVKNSFADRADYFRL